jgi:RNA polymerase sigma-70 factor (ECF subfamily)
MVAPALDLDDLFRRYSRYVSAIGLRLLGRRDEVDDLVQDVFLAAMGGIDSVRDPGAIKAWLMTIAVRSARRRLRQRRMRAFLGLDHEVDYERVADRDAPPEKRLVIRRVYEVLDTMPANERIAWTLRHIQGERLQAVALLCDCSLATAKRRIAAASARVNEAVGDG